MSIDVRHVSKTFGNYVALRDVSLRVNAGEMVALLGPSGSGKTTLLRIIAGLEQPDPTADAEIRFDDARVTQTSVRQRRVGFVFQHYALFRHMTVFDNVAFGLTVRPRRERPARAEIQDRVNRLLQLVQLDGMSRRYPAQLSGGQRQRVALARALAVEPQVLLLDEPFGALDAKVRKGLRDWLRQLHEEIQLTSILVTHDQEEALEVADRVVVMNQARIEQVGTPDEVFHQPASEFVMQFLGTVNVFHGRIRRGQASVGNVTIECPEYENVEDHAATIYFRPHELEVQRHANGKPGLTGRINRIHTAGTMTKLVVSTDAGGKVTVDLSAAEHRFLAPQVGESVFVVPKAARVFVPDDAVADYHI